MSLTKNPVYNQLKETLGPYCAVIEIASNAREIAESLDGRITDSMALDFAARGEVPDPKDYPDHRLDRVEDYISYIEDSDIKSSIVSSYEESLKRFHLVYMYGSIYDEPRRSRVRIILNILWDNRPHKKG